MQQNILLVIFVLISLIGSAGELIKSSVFENYSVSNGLFDEKIHCVFQDSKGLIWLGTDYGVTRFDGYEFTQLNLNSDKCIILTKSLIRTIYEDPNGIIWIGSDFEGIFKYDRKANTLKQYKDKGFTHNSVWAIVQDSMQNLWLGTEGGITYFNPSTESVEHTITVGNNSHMPGNWVRKIFIKNNNEFWLGTDKGIAVFDNDFNFKRAFLTGLAYKARENEVWEIFQDGSHDIWVGTYLAGLLKYTRKTNSFETIELDANNSRAITVRSIIQDKNGDLWFGTRGGLYSLNKGTNKKCYYKNEDNNSYSLIHNSVLNLQLDKKGDLWVGTRNGLSYLNFDKQAFGYISANKDNSGNLNDGEVYSIWEDDLENLWFGTESGGINIYNPKKEQISYVTTENGLSINCIKALCPDNNGNVLVGTYLGGLNVYNPKTGNCKVFRHKANNPNSISGDEVWAIIKDSENKIWVGTSGGLDLFDEKREVFIHFGDKYNLKQVSMIFEDKNRNFWIYSASTEQMTLVFPDGKYKQLDVKSRAMCEDIDGNLWLATLGSGLLKLNKKGDVIDKYTMTEGLTSNVLQGIVNINNEVLWLSSNNGISKFDIDKKEFKNFFISDGLLNDKFNYAAFCKTKSNSLAFGGKKGVDFVYLDRINKNEYIPTIIITKFRLFNKEVLLTDTIGNKLLSNLISETNKLELDYDQNMISFDFAALNYANSNKNKYLYKLEGFDKEWNDIGTSRVATYTNLDYGEYIFKVIGSNNDNVYNEKGVELSIIIHPPVWKTIWFRFLALCALIILVFLIFRMIHNREKLKHELIYERQAARNIHELDRLKHQFFMNISHEIRTPLSLIIGPLDKILSMNMDNAVVATNLKLIKRNTVNLKKLVNQLLDYRKIETGNLKLDLQKGNIRVFVEEIVDSFRYSAQDKDIDLRFNSSQKSIFTNFDADKLEKILNNLISNAIKYTQVSGKISITVTLVFADDIEGGNLLIPQFDIDQTMHKRYVKIKVVDSGIGISAEDLPKIFDRFRRIKQEGKERIQGAGIGLALTKELVKIHNGHLKVRSELGQGSRFSIFLPFDENVHEGELEDVAKEQEKRIELEKQELNRIKNQAIALVIDDNVDLRSFIKSHFEPDFKVFEAKNGKDGWEQALETIPDIVIADVMMPIMDGNELCKKLKHDERTSHIPIIMLSALGSSENQLAGIDAGADDYLTKPFDVGLLKAKVENILSIRKSLRERYSKEMILKPKDIVLASPDEKFLKRLINLIEKNIANDSLDVEYIALNLDVSRTQLYRKIGALTDMSPKEFVRDQRLKRAAQMVLQNRLNISEVAYGVGFNDVAYFRKCFKEKFGMSASEYFKKNS